LKVCAYLQALARAGMEAARGIDEAEVGRRGHAVSFPWHAALPAVLKQEDAPSPERALSVSTSLRLRRLAKYPGLPGSIQSAMTTLAGEVIRWLPIGSTTKDPPFEAS
jgi:hypothetical protein